MCYCNGTFLELTLTVYDGLNGWLSFIKCHLGAALPEPANTEALHMEVAELKQKCNLLIVENKELRNRVRC